MKYNVFWRSPTLYNHNLLWLLIQVPVVLLNYMSSNKSSTSVMILLLDHSNKAEVKPYVAILSSQGDS